VKRDADLALEVRLLRERVEDLAAQQESLMRMLLSRADRRTGAALVPLLADYEAGPFGVAELAAQTLNDRTPDGQALRELIAEYLTGDGGFRAFGWLLARLEGVTFAGCRLVRVGKARGVERWRVLCRGKPSANDNDDEAT
jgi:hypothetical protein